jgi:hypothetical protein
MSRHGAPERIAIRLARLIAGPDRRLWLDAMEAELDHLPRQRRLDWAFGILAAAAKDGAARAIPPLALLIALPCLAFAAVDPAFKSIMQIVRATDASVHLALPATHLLPLAAGMLLGTAHRWHHPLRAGTLAFAVHQVVPSLYYNIGREPDFFFWAIDLRPLGIGSEPTVLGLLVLWCLGVMLGTRLREGARNGRAPNR